ncbi:MAG: WhiB family transcriptional regulator [Actinomycetota bacterium]|nr:WhiB family transcriptional regulator [Actinomycetota bacterium]
MLHRELVRRRLGTRPVLSCPQAGWLMARTARSVPTPDLSTGACRTLGDPSWWFSDSESEREAARHICQGCPVLAACRTWALAAPATMGVLGGLSSSQRVAEKRRRRAAASLASRSPRAAIEAAKTHCDHGHPFSGANLALRVRPSGSVWRICKRCQADRRRAVTRLRSLLAGQQVAA